MLRTDLLGYLGEDIFYLILEMMSESHRSSLLSMSLVCKGWHQQVQPFIDRHVEIITSPEPGHHSTLMDRLQDQSFWAKIKSISIWPGLEEDFLPENSQIITTLQGLLPELHLVSFSWYYWSPMPLDMSEILSRQSNCRIYMDTSRRLNDLHQYRSWYWRPTWFQYFPSTLSRIMPVWHMLRSLELTIQLGGDGERSALLGQMLAKATSLSSLSLNAKAIVPRDGGDPNPNLDYLSPHTKSLKLHLLELQGFCACNTQVQDWWHGIIDWRSPSIISFTCPSFLKCIPRQSDNLERLRVWVPRTQRGQTVENLSCNEGGFCHYPPSSQEIVELLSSLPPLKGLQLKNVLYDSKIFDSQPRLEHLDMINDAALSPSNPLEISCPKHTIACIAANCSNIRKLAIRVEPQDLKTFLELTIRNLTLLQTLVLDVGVPSRDPRYELDRPADEDLEACLRIFNEFSTIHLNLPESLPTDHLQLHITLAVVLSLREDEASNAWVLAERHFRLNARTSRNKRVANIMAVLLDSQDARAQEACLWAQREVYRGLNPSITKITRLGYNTFPGAGMHTMMFQILDQSRN